MQPAHTFIEAAAARGHQLAPTIPSFVQARRASIASLERDGVPSGKLETWKYTSIAPFFSAPFGADEVAANAERPAAADRFFAFDSATPILFRGAQPDLLGVLSRSGVHLTALGNLGAVPAARLNAGLDFARYPLAHVNTALLETGLVIALDEGVDAGGLDLRFASGSSAANISHVRIELAAGSRLRLIEQHAQHTPTNCVIEVALARGASCEHMRVAPRGSQPCWNLVSVHVGDDASYSLAGYAMGSTPSRTDVHVHLDGVHARTDISLACGSHGRDRLDHQIVVEHIGTDTVSRQTYHGIAAGASELTFNGRIHIHPGAQRSDARLTNKNLLADRKARINTKPELEIHANDVKCGHGATVGQIDPVQLFYLRSRGLDESAARAILLRAFLSSRLTDTARNAGVETIFAELFAR
jgi:Fe-S cluster assembly protein SufD